MTNKLLLAALMTVSIFTMIPAYAEEPLQINTEIGLEQALIVLGIGILGAVVTSLEGMKKSGNKFDPGKFLIAVKRTAAISIPATFGLLAFYPNPDGTAYVMIGIVIIFGSKMIHSKPSTSKISKISANENTSVTVDATIDKQIVIPKLGPVGAKYQTNFVKGDLGNTLPFGTNLWIKRPGVRSFVSAILRDAKNNMIQVDQSHINDEDGDITTTRLEMFGKDGSPLPRGKYSIATLGDSGPGDAEGNKPDVFFIV